MTNERPSLADHGLDNAEGREAVSAILDAFEDALIASLSECPPESILTEAEVHAAVADAGRLILTAIGGRDD